MITNALEVNRGRVLRAQVSANDPALNPMLRQFNERKAVSRALKGRGERILHEARAAYDSRSDYRARRKRSRNYYRNKPDEKVKDPETGLLVSEDEYVKSQGRYPYKMDQISGVTGNILGQFMSYKTQRMAFGVDREDNEAARQMTSMVNYTNKNNLTHLLDADNFEENLISGMYGWKVGHKFRYQTKRFETTIDNINTNSIFFSSGVSDRRMFDLGMIGELHDYTLDEVFHWFAQNRYEADWLRRMYQNRGQDMYSANGYQTGFALSDAMDFYQSADPSKCRVIEVWKLEWDWRNFVHDTANGTYEESDMREEEIAELNKRRYLEALQYGMQSPQMLEVQQQYEPVWSVYYLTPFGDVLLARRTPYWHEQHPYSLGFGYFFDGEIWGLVEKIIDPQRLINRITSAMDYMFGASAKGVLLVDEDMVPDDMTPEEFADQYTRFNGMIMFKAKPGQQMPKQISANAIPAGMFTWLANSMQQIKDVSGTHGAALGQEASSGSPASMYQMQIAQSQITNRHLIDNFLEVRRMRDLRVCQVNAQYYKEQMRIPIDKQPDGTSTILWDPSRVRDIEWDIAVEDAPDTPVTRQLMETELQGHLNTNRISFKQFLTASGSPYADVILQLIEKTNPILAQAEVNPEGAATLEEQFRQMAANGDRDASAYVSQLA